MPEAPEPQWQVIWSSSAAKAMGRLPRTVVDAVAAFADGPLTTNPYRVSKALHAPFEGKRSAYRGSYRVLIEIDDDAQTVRIYDVLHRADAYRPR